jgi:hypothetical protein
MTVIQNLHDFFHLQLNFAKGNEFSAPMEDNDIIAVIQNRVLSGGIRARYLSKHFVNII